MVTAYKFMKLVIVESIKITSYVIIVGFPTSLPELRF
jgi:hypothetical protein